MKLFKIMKHKISLLVVVFFITINSIYSQNNEMETKVLIKTSVGDITIKLYNETEYHKNNFIKLVEQNFYDGVLFHRVINAFMIQTGDPDSKNASADKQLGRGGPGYTIPAEITPKFYHKKGALSAARTSDQMNPTRRSSGSQFYLVTGKVYSDSELNMFEKQAHTKLTKEQREAYMTIGGTPHLDGQYSVFGEITDGIEIIDKIQKVKTGAGDRPIEDIKIIEMTIIK